MCFCVFTLCWKQWTLAWTSSLKRRLMLWK
nr:MAG TPA: hypothetical protein [Caudoviricetes sp.]